MRFKNLKTGNIVASDNKATIALMEKSERYVAVTAKAAKTAKDKDKDKSAQAADPAATQATE